MLHNLKHNMLDFADNAGWGEDVASIAQAENIHVDILQQLSGRQMVHQRAKPSRKPKPTQRKVSEIERAILRQTGTWPSLI